jgi:phosphoribosylamine--glycine ligase/phosphoribosylformylglycinamidine cyclo-ligase
MSGNDLVTSGGRVMAVTCSAPTLEQALTQVYTAVDKISFEGKFYRRDIAHRQAPHPSDHN